MTLSNLFKKLRPRKLRSQLILGIASILVVLISLLVMELMTRQKNFFLKLNHERGFALSTTLASTANAYVISYELAGLQKLVSTYKNNPGLQYAIVTSDDGIVLAHTNEKYLGQKATDSVSATLKQINATQTLIENSSTLDIATPIINHDQIVGWARIGLSQEYIAPNLKAIRKSGLLFILISLIVGSLFAIIVAGRLSKGLQKLVTAAEKIKDGNRDLRVGASKSVEISQLGTAFNQMLDDISSNEKLLSMVLENMPVGIWILDEKGKIKSANAASKELWKEIKYVGADEYDVYKGWFTETGKVVQSHEWAAAIVLKEGKPVLDQEIEIECFDKTHKIILNSAIPLRDANEKTIGVIVINVDITDLKKAENTRNKVNREKAERVKELNCLYRMSELSNDPLKKIEDIMQVCVDIIPPAYQHPEIACARIVFGQQVFESVNFIETSWKLEADIISKDVAIGRVEVFYKEQVKDEYEGPFLKEERFLINSIADILGSSAERKMAELVIKEQAETFSAIIENANESIWLLSPDLKVLQFNKTAKEKLKLNRGKEINIGADFKDFLYPGSENIFMSMFNAARAGEYTEQESCQANIKGEMFWLRTKMYPIYGIQKKLIGITILTENITDRKKAEESIKQSEANYRQLFDNSPAPMWVIDENTSAIIQVNQACIKNYGYSHEEFLSMTINDISPNEQADTSRKNMNALFFGASQRHVKKSGELIDVVTSSIPVKLNDEKSILMTAIDVTEKNIYEQKLTKAAIKVQEDERYEIGGELHDNVCQLLATSLMFLGLVKRSLPEKATEMYDQTHKCITMATDEIRNLSHRLAPAFFDDEILEDALKRLLKTFNAENKYTITLEVDKELKFYPMSRDLQMNLYRILQEQLRNIMKHAKATNIRVGIVMTDDGLQMKITDDGIGFDAAKSKGGIGLANMNRRVQLFSGVFTINSSVGNGCEVLVDIPLAGAD